jgi:hypothetical protein
MIENMVASDGVEPPTPAFSDLSQPELSTTYRTCGRLPSTCEHVLGRSIMGWDHGLGFSELGRFAESCEAHAPKRQN